MVLLASTLALLAAGAGCAFIMPGVAHAGSIAVVSCRLPNGAPAPTEGWSGGWSGSPLPSAGDSNNCSGNGGSLSAYVGDQIEQPGSAGPYWEYAPPAGFTLTGGQVTASFDVPGSNISPYTGATALAGPKFGFDAADIIGGIPGGTTDLVESTYSLTGHTGGHLWVYAFCEPPGSPCPTGYSRQWFWALGSIEQAILLLSNNEHPSASGFTGGMTTTGAVAGNQNLVFQAADAGSGVYEVKATLGSQVVYAGTPNTNSGECVPVGTYGSTREFVSASPCQTSESVTLPVETATVHDGQHELTIDVIDAAGNETTVYSKIVETHNAPSVTARPSLSGVASVGSILTGANGSFTASTGAGAVSSVSGQWLRCTDAAAMQCSSIAQATGLSYQVQPADAGYYLVYSDTASDNDGSTTSDSLPTTLVTGASGSSSCAGGECLHAGGSGGPGGAGGAGASSSSSGSGSGVTVDVLTPGNGTLVGSPAKWSVTLKASPGLVRRGTSLKLAGTISTSPRPAEGKLVYVQARSVTRVWRRRGRGRHRITVYGKWMTFVALRTGGNGAWHTTYKFRLGGQHTYQMQAVAPREGGFQNPSGSSPVITISER
jgi:hypothetical protein